MYSSTFSLISAPDGGKWSMPCPCCFTPGERDPVPIQQEAGWAPGPVWMSIENLAPTSYMRISQR
jgi:hypothetical protein